MLNTNELKYNNYDDIESFGSNPNNQLAPMTQILSNIGLLNYIKQVYFYTGIGWSCVLISGELMSLTISKSNIHILQWIYLSVGFCMSIFTMILCSSPNYNPKLSLSLETEIKRENVPTWKIVSYLLFSYSLGLILSPAVFIVNNYNHIIFPLSILITNSIFMIIQFVVWMQKDISGIKFYTPLISCVSGLIMIGIIEIVLGCLGFDKTVLLLSFGTSIISIIIFTGLIFVDTLKAIESYNKSELNSIRCSIEIVLDLANILINMMDCLMTVLASSDD